MTDDETQETEAINMAELMESLTTAFDPIEEMAQSGELRRTSFRDLKSRIKQYHKLLITHRGDPEMVMMTYDAYRRLLQHVTELEQRVEEADIARAFPRRFEQPIDPDDYVDEDAFQQALGQLENE